MSKYAKLYVALAGGLVAVLTSLYGVNTPLVQAVVAILTSLGVYQVANR